MKKYVWFFFTLVLFIACTNTIGYLPDDEPKKLIVNALLTAGSDNNFISLRYTGWTATTPATDGIIQLYINGEPTETITAKDEIYPVKSIFHPGDKVRIEASAGNGTYRAEAETRIEVPLQVVRIDTSYVKLRDYDSWIGDKPKYDNYLRLKIQLKQPDTKATDNYYRLEIYQVYHSHEWHENRDSLRIYTSYNYNYSYDTALTDGKPGHAIDEGFELIPKWNNYFGLFKSNYFKQGEYRLTVDLKESSNYYAYQTDRYITVRLYSISESEYRYLHALASAIDYDSDNFIYSVPLLPNDIEGGIGIFSIASKVESYLEELDR